MAGYYFALYGQAIVQGRQAQMDTIKGLVTDEMLADIVNNFGNKERLTGIISSNAVLSALYNNRAGRQWPVDKIEEAVRLITIARPVVGYDSNQFAKLTSYAVKQLHRDDQTKHGGASVWPKRVWFQAIGDHHTGWGWTTAPGDFVKTLMTTLAR